MKGARPIISIAGPVQVWYKIPCFIVLSPSLINQQLINQQLNQFSRSPYYDLQLETALVTNITFVTQN